MARGKRAQEEEGGGAPGWMVTYGDMMSLLLTFFVLLISFSTIHQEEFNRAIASLHGALGLMPSPRHLIDLREPIPEMSVQRFQDVAAKIAEYIRVHGRDKDIHVQFTAEGLKLTMQDPVLFDTGEDALKPEAAPVLADVAGLLSELSDNFISIQGHTDNVPIRTARFASNLELSAARAISVARFLIDKGGIDPNNVSVIGYSENLPIARNDSPENRAKNRRVEIHVLKVRPGTVVPGYRVPENEEMENAA
jgi:chemotaxis protein MotB